MTKSPWGEIEIPKEEEKEHQLKLKKRIAGKKAFAARQSWLKNLDSYWLRSKGKSRPPNVVVEEGFTVVHDKEELMKVLQTILDKGGPVDIIYEGPVDEEYKP